MRGVGAGHAFAAAISACASGGNWARALTLFNEMLLEKIQPDVVSCTALVTAMASDGQYEHAQHVITWMTQVIDPACLLNRSASISLRQKVAWATSNSVVFGLL